MIFIRVRALTPVPAVVDVCNPLKLLISVTGRLLLAAKSFAPVVPGAVLPKAPIVAEAYVLVPVKSDVPGVNVELLLNRISPLNRNACFPCVQLNVSETVHVGVFPFEVGATLQPEATPAAGAFVGGLEP
jgi:hypothetical protein